MLVHMDDYQPHHKCHVMTLGIEVRLLTCWYEYAQKCYEVHAYITQWSTKLIEVYTNDTCHENSQECLPLTY